MQQQKEKQSAGPISTSAAPVPIKSTVMKGSIYQKLLAKKQQVGHLFQQQQYRVQRCQQSEGGGTSAAADSLQTFQNGQGINKVTQNRGQTNGQAAIIITSSGMPNLGQSTRKVATQGNGAGSKASKINKVGNLQTARSKRTGPEDFGKLSAGLRNNKSARSSQSRSKSNKGKNILVLDQIQRGTIIGRNNNLNLIKTCQEQRQCSDIERDFPESLCENKTDHSAVFEKKTASKNTYEMASNSIDVQPDAQSFDCIPPYRKKEKQLGIYSRNIDSSQITRTQINKYFKQRKKPTSVGQSPKKMSENQFQTKLNGRFLKLNEKENHIELQQQGYHTEIDPKNLQILQSSRSYNNNTVNQGPKKIHLGNKPSISIKEPLSKKYSTNYNQKSKAKVKSNSRTRMDGVNSH